MHIGSPRLSIWALIAGCGAPVPGESAAVTTGPRAQGPRQSLTLRLTFADNRRRRSSWRGHGWVDGGTLSSRERR